MSDVPFVIVFVDVPTVFFFLVVVAHEGFYSPVLVYAVVCLFYLFLSMSSAKHCIHRFIHTTSGVPLPLLLVYVC